MLARHEIPDTYATSGYNNRNLCTGRYTHRVYCKFMFIYVLLFLKNVVKIPNFDASVYGGSENRIFITRYEGLNFDNSLEMGCKTFHQCPIIHIPNNEFLADPRHCQHISFRKNNVVRLIKAFTNISHTTWKSQFYGFSIVNFPKLKPFLCDTIAPLFILGEF